ncbi:hypothetical protein ABZX75_32065 [Streptomyces sp. NPDC003038]|uniref:hypothetical protein n=1 Tax=unclassified Streptomyces TaxID=2593676 RepID=UPI0033B0DBA2
MVLHGHTAALWWAAGCMLLASLIAGPDAHGPGIEGPPATGPRGRLVNGSAVNQRG